MASETDRPVPAARPGDIPFGGGGNWLAFDAAVRLGLRPRLVRGRADNLKVTNPEDAAFAEAILRSGKP